MPRPQLHFSSHIATAGAITLWIQITLPIALKLASIKRFAVQMQLTGGSNLGMSPSEFHCRFALIPLLERMLPMGSMRQTLASLLVKGRGFFPRGGGRVQVTVDPIECVGRCVLRPLLLDCDNGAHVRVVGFVCGTLPRMHMEKYADSLRASIQLALSFNRIRNQLLNGK